MAHSALVQTPERRDFDAAHFEEQLAGSWSARECVRWECIGVGVEREGQCLVAAADDVAAAGLEEKGGVLMSFALASFPHCGGRAARRGEDGGDHLYEHHHHHRALQYK